MNKKTVGSILMGICLLGMTGCVAGGGVQMVATPNLFLDPGSSPYAAVPVARQTTHMDMIYATDRVAISDPALFYGHDRSPSLAFGVCRLDMGHGLDWQALTKATRSLERTVEVPLWLVSAQEMLRYPDSTTPMLFRDGLAVEDPEFLKAQKVATGQVQDLVASFLQKTDRKEAFIYVHGASNQFTNSAYGMSVFYHYLGRNGVPIMYTWPSSLSSHMIRGYNYDRESSEFTVFHFKQMIKAVAGTPGLEKLHIIAHSRGTDVFLSALRELHIQYQAEQVETRQKLKLGTVVIVAGDIDFEVLGQRVTAERLGNVPERIVLYISKGDGALGLSSWLSDGGKRLGNVTGDMLGQRSRDALKQFANVEVIDVQTTTDAGFLSHGYFVENPAVLSDLVLLLRDGRAIGKEHGRPMQQNAIGFWELKDGYPNLMHEDAE